MSIDTKTTTSSLVNLLIVILFIIHLRTHDVKESPNYAFSSIVFKIHAVVLFLLKNHKLLQIVALPI